MLPFPPNISPRLGSFSTRGDFSTQIHLKMTSLPSSETLQLVILHAVDAAPITDSRTLSLQLPANVDGAQSLGAPRVIGAGADEQNAIKGALDSLVAREVRFPLLASS